MKSFVQSCDTTTFCVNMPRSIEEVTKEHVKHFYGGAQPNEFSAYDKKLIASIMKINQTYQEDMKKRKYVVLVTDKEGESLYMKKSPSGPIMEKIEAAQQVQSKATRRCQHLKKDGCVCNCVIKDLTADFCGIHSRKKK